eukprot:jgi/Orpsp1_1/1191326/evm.model.d7180000084974.1
MKRLPLKILLPPISFLVLSIVLLWLRTILIGVSIFTCGAIIQGLSTSSWVIIAIGLSIGCNGVLCPSYITEVAPANIR